MSTHKHKANKVEKDKKVEGKDEKENEEADLNVDNYTVDELLQILNLYEPTLFQVKDTVYNLLARLHKEGKKDLITFFEAANTKILNKIKPQTQYLDPDQNQELIDTIWKESSFHPTGDEETSYYAGNEHFPAKDKFINKSASAKIISTRIITIDSQYRQQILPYSTNPIDATYNTNFTFNLANPIYNAISITLYSYSIPTTFYTFTTKIGNTFFQYNGIIIQIPDGNYTVKQLVDTINAIAAQNLATAGLVVTGPDPNNGKLTFTNQDPLTTDVTVVLYIQNNTTNLYTCGGQVLAGLFQTVGINNTLGWFLGFRTNPDINTGDVYFTLNSGQSVVTNVPPDVYGSKYFILNVEDFSNQRLTSGLTSITNTKTQATLNVPDYYNTINVACQLQSGNLTRAQLFSINALQQDNNVNTLNAASIFANRLQAPNIGSAFAFVPLANISLLREQGLPLVVFGANAIFFSRKYIKPIRLERIHVSLVDDKNNLVNLNDNNWNFSLVVEQQVG